VVADIRRRQIDINETGLAVDGVLHFIKSGTLSLFGP
jgi:hypothetical protein